MKRWINIDNVFALPCNIEKEKKKKLIKRKMLIQKKINVYFDLDDLKEYISRITPSNSDYQLHQIIEAVKQQNINLQEIANEALKKKHTKKLQKSYIHCPVNNE